MRIDLKMKLLLGLCLTLTAGCATIGDQPINGPAVSNTGGVPQTTGPSVHTPSVRPPSVRASIADQQATGESRSPASSESSLAQVDYTQQVDDTSPVTFVGDEVPCSPQGCPPQGVGQAACGCQSCKPGIFGGCLKGCLDGCLSCQPRQQGPHGYALQSGPWNAYGIDPQEFICDGGDHPPEAALRRDESIAGLQPEDTVVHYTNQAGDIEFEASNRVCLYAPRFLAVRQISGALAGGGAVGAAQMDRPLGPIRVDQPLPGLVMTETVELLHADVSRRLDAIRERNRGVPVEGILQPELAADVLAVLVGLTIDEILLLQEEERALLDKYLLCAVTWQLEEALEVVIEDLKPPTLVRDEHVDGLTVYEFPDGRLRICKLADRADALPGELVNFAIRVENVGDAPVENIVLTDNLTTRLEYVEGSQTCSGGAIFESFENEGQSLRLQWKLTDKLRVGEGVTIRFQCRVR